MIIQAPYIANLFEYASYNRVPEKNLRSFLNTKDVDVCNQNNTISEVEYLNVFEALLKATADKYFGIHYGCYLNIKALGFVVQLSLNASSIEQAVFIVKNYLQTTFPLVSIESELEGDEYSIRILSSIENVFIKNQVLDFVFCFIYRELKLILPDNIIPDMEVPNSNTAEFALFLNTEPLQGTGYRFTFNSSVLTKEINSRKLKQIEILLPKYLQMLNKTKTEYKEFSMQVRNVVLSLCSPELPTFEQVSSHFPLSFRSLQRKLTEEGISFRQITNDIKIELATYLSKGNKMKTQDVAFFLGYSSASAYLHAVKNWKRF